MNKIKLIVIMVLAVSCNKVNQHDCICYDGIGTDSVSWEVYITKNNKLETEQYCEMVSTPERPCWVSE